MHLLRALCTLKCQMRVDQGFVPQRAQSYCLFSTWRQTVSRHRPLLSAFLHEVEQLWRKGHRRDRLGLDRSCAVHLCHQAVWLWMLQVLLKERCEARCPIWIMSYEYDRFLSPHSLMAPDRTTTNQESASRSGARNWRPLEERKTARSG